MEQRRASPIGIDLGTAYTRIAVINGTQCRMIPDQHGNSAMPSYVAFTNSGLLVGDAARAQAPHNPANTIFDVIRLIGRRYTHPSVQNDMRRWPFKVIAGPDERLQVEVNWDGRMWRFNAVEICSMLLMQIKENTEKVLATTVTDAVITVPVSFNYDQRLAIKQAGMIAGLNFTQIISAPAACAFFYGTERPSKSTDIISNVARSLFSSGPNEHNMVIFDLGAGTFNVAVVTIKEDVCSVRATAGDVHLGGSDFDNNLVDYFVSELKRRGGKDIRNTPMAINKLRTLCEKAKISLSSGSIMVPMEATPLYNDVNFESSITEAKFNELNNYLFIKCINIMETCLIDSGISIDAVHEIIFAGSSSGIPLLKYYIQRFFGNKVKTISQHLEAVTAYGAAFQAFFLSRSGNGRAQGLSLQDAAPFSLGLGGLGTSLPGRMHVFIKKNMNIPVRIENTFPSNGRPFLVEVYEGEGALICENNCIWKFELSESQISSKWNRIKVTFEIHQNGMLTVTAQELPHGKRKTTTFTCNKIEDSQNLVREALLYKKCEKGVNKASTTKSVTRSGSSRNWDKIRDTQSLGKLMSMEKDKSSKIKGQSSRQYVDPEEYAIGIDFGTTYSSVAVWRRNGAKIIANEYGSRLTCSVVAFTDTGRLIGDTVHKEQVTTNPANTIFNIKRLIGRRYSDQQVQNDSKFVPFKILCNDQKRSMVSIQYKNEGKLFAPEEIAAMILSKMREIAEAHLNSTVTKAVISVPASFNDSQRKAIKDAGIIAGLNVMQLLNEPTAAAIAYFSQKNSGESFREKILLIFDLGGGNLDVSIVAIKEGSIRVQAVAGDTNLGGEDFDNNIVSYFVKKFKKEKKRDISNKPRSLRRLRAACEKSKRVLSTNAQTVVEIDALDDGIDFRSAMTRKTFEEINEGLFKRCIGCVERCLEDAEMDRSRIDEVVLIGGSTRIPKMQQVLQEFFNGKELCKSMNADEAVAYGAAIQAAILSGNEGREKFNILKLQDVTSLSFGLENKDGATTNLLFPKNTPIPATKELTFTNCTDGLPGFSIEVQECELASKMVFNLFGITPKPRVKSKINMSFEVDDSGILNLTAKDMSTREKNEIEINKENGGLTIEEIQKMVEAEASFKADDEEHKKRATALNSLENFAYKLKAIAREAGLSAPNKKLVEAVADEVIEWLETNHHAAIDEISARKKKLETIENQVRSAALNSLGNLANEIKALAQGLGVPASDTKMENATDEALAWLEANQHARIDEINDWKKKLETIINRLRSDALNYIRNMAYEIKEIARCLGLPASDTKLEDAADEALTWLEANQHARIDEINDRKMQLQTIRIQLRYDALNYLGKMAYEIKEIARGLGLPASEMKIEDAADEALAWLEANQHARIDELNDWKKKLQTIRMQLRSDALNYLGNMACEIKELASNPGYSAFEYKKSMEEAAKKTLEWLATDLHAGFDEIKKWKEYLETIKAKLP